MAAAALLAGACATDLDTEPTLNHDELTEIARATSDSGAVYTFAEGAPGEIILHIVAPDGVTEGKEAARALDANELSFTELYHQVADAPAPDALVAAENRADTQRALRQADDDDSMQPSASQGDATGTLTQAISAADFQNQFCGSAAWDYTYCWPSTAGNPYVQRKTYTMYGYMAAVNHTTRFRFRYKTVAAGSWKTLADAQALPGQVHHIYQRYFGYKRWRRWEILDNSGKPVRYACYGTE